MLLGIGVAGVVATGVTAWAVANSPILVNRTGDVIWRSLFVAVYVAVGEYTWWRRPESPLGPLIAGLGFVYALTSLNAAGAPLAYTIGMVAWAGYIVFTGYVFLCFPRGWLESTLERRFMLAFAFGTAVVWALILPLSLTLPAGSDFTNCGTDCPHNALQIVSGDASTGKALVIASNVLFTAAALGVAMFVFHKARSPGHLRRRAVTPLAVVVIVQIFEFVLSLFLPSAFPETAGTLKVLNGLTYVGIPVAMFAGQVRGDIFAAVRLSRIAMHRGAEAVTPAAVQTMIRDALGDPTLELSIWAPERAGYVDPDGAPMSLPQDTGARAVTEITRDGQPVAALLHDSSLDTDSDVVQGLAATSLMLLDNTMLVEELRRSRLRIAETGDRERRRLERDLHDGAQQRLMAIQIKLRMLQDSTEDQEIAGQLEAIGIDAEAAVEELRSLAQGIYPPVLRDYGLADALRAFAMLTPTRIAIVDNGIGRCPRAIESAIYFCSMEAIQNVVKHAGDEVRATATLGRDGGRATFAIADDGVGMDTSAPGDGDGLGGMRDRIGAVGGELRIASTPGVGTTVRGTVALDPGVAGAHGWEDAS